MALEEKKLFVNNKYAKYNLVNDNSNIRVAPTRSNTFPPPPSTTDPSSSSLANNNNNPYLNRSSRSNTVSSFTSTAASASNDDYWCSSVVQTDQNKNDNDDYWNVKTEATATNQNNDSWDMKNNEENNGVWNVNNIEEDIRNEDWLSENINRKKNECWNSIVENPNQSNNQKDVEDYNNIVETANNNDYWGSELQDNQNNNDYQDNVDYWNSTSENKISKENDNDNLNEEDTVSIPTPITTISAVTPPKEENPNISNDNDFNQSLIKKLNTLSTIDQQHHDEKKYNSHNYNPRIIIDINNVISNNTIDTTGNTNGKKIQTFVLIEQKLLDFSDDEDKSPAVNNNSEKETTTNTATAKKKRSADFKIIDMEGFLRKDLEEGLKKMVNGVMNKNLTSSITILASSTGKQKMKFLDIASLEPINAALVFENPECRVVGRIETYSCKLAGVDKKLYKNLESQWNNNLSQQNAQSVSPDAHSFDTIISPFGSMDQPSSRRTLFNLIATLNASYPDYDFSDVKPDQFTKQPSVPMVCNYINNTLFNLGRAHIINDLMLWQTVDDIIFLDECNIYSFNPDSDADPNSDDGVITTAPLQEDEPLDDTISETEESDINAMSYEEYVMGDIEM
ncbi:24893_t:CDS:10 [Entrophospora sp. SA101]|nr:24893_t:CDS:10 [Entrophospora sp. SA101]CAJ0842116.1 1133_t:CDS:10 [Entrophospora sp. SA101]